VSWWVIVNPGAGGGRHDAVARTTTALREHGIDAEVRASSSPDNVAELVDEARRQNYSDFVAVGGDGTTNLVVDALMRRSWDEPPVLGVLPAGSGSDLIRTFGRSQVLEESVKYLAGDDTYPVDVGHIIGQWGDRYFINVAEVGIGADVVRLAARLPHRLGAFRYKAAIWPILARFPRRPIKLTADDKVFESEAIIVVMANAQFFGGGMNVAPKGSMVDGRLDVQVFTGPKRQVITLQPRLTRGTHLTHRHVRRFVASRVRVEGIEGWGVEADGEYLGEGGVEASVVESAIRFKI